MIDLDEIVRNLKLRGPNFEVLILDGQGLLLFFTRSEISVVSI